MTKEEEIAFIKILIKNKKRKWGKHLITFITPYLNEDMTMYQITVLLLKDYNLEISETRLWRLKHTVNANIKNRQNKDFSTKDFEKLKFGSTSEPTKNSDDDYDNSFEKFRNDIDNPKSAIEQNKLLENKLIKEGIERGNKAVKVLSLYRKKMKDEEEAKRLKKINDAN